jgi:hypothetical protein
MKKTAPNAPPPIALSIRAACKQFDPPLSQRAIRRLIREGRLVTHKIGARGYILHNELVATITSLPPTKEPHHGRR